MEEKTHTKSIVEISREGDFRYLLSYRSKLLPWGGGALPGGQGGWGKLCCCFSSISDMCFKYCANAVTVILNINLMYWQGGYNDITIHLV